MSVIVITRFAVADMARAKAALASNAPVLDQITEEAKSRGARHHRFLQADGDLISLDEWDSGSSFQRFFESNTKIAQITQQAGVLGPPRIEMYDPVEAAGDF